MKTYNVGTTIKLNVNTNVQANSKAEAIEILKQQIEDTFPLMENDTKHELYLWITKEEVFIKRYEFAEEIEE